MYLQSYRGNISARATRPYTTQELKMGTRMTPYGMRKHSGFVVYDKEYHIIFIFKTIV